MFAEERTLRKSCRQPAGTYVGVLAGSGVSPVPREVLVNPRMPFRGSWQGLEGQRGQASPAKVYGRAHCVPGVVGNCLLKAWGPGSKLVLDARSPGLWGARPHQHTAQSGTHMYPHVHCLLSCPAPRTFPQQIHRGFQIRG